VLEKAFSKVLGTTPGVAAGNIILVANAFLWYFYAFNVLKQVITTDPLVIWGVNFLAIAISAILGSVLVNRLGSRDRFLLSWIAAGVFLSAMPLALDLNGNVGVLTMAATFGAYFGFGMPICMGYFASSTNWDNRSRLGGTTFFCIGLGTFLLGGIGATDILTSVSILACLRAFGFFSFLPLRGKNGQIKKESKVSFRNIITNRPFLLYFVPWLMFALVNSMVFPVISEFFGAEFALSSSIIESVLIGVFAVIGGFVADFFGRKRLAMAGFAMLGLGYAILGLFGTNVAGWYFYTFVDGIAWGAFYTVFLITLWGDLAQEGASEKYYAIGALPYLLSNFVRLWLSPLAAEIPKYAVFSFTSLFLFLAVLPLAYAPETLPEKTMKERDLKNYIEKAKKEVAKAQKREEGEKEEEDEESNVEFEVAQEDAEEAEKLAEKYY
jgi:hypothetical protein